jgi:hypothetical protein
MLHPAQAYVGLLLFQYTFALCTAVLSPCLGQSIVSHSAASLEEPQQTLDEARVPPHDAWIQQNLDLGRGQARLDTSYMPPVEAGQLVDQAQVDQTRDDMKTDEYRFWGFRPYYGRRWGWGWNVYPSWGWGWNGYRGWNRYGYGRRYPSYGYYW